MHRTQIYLPEQDYVELLRLGEARGQSMAEIIRSAVRNYLKGQSTEHFREALESTHGLWRDREIDLRDLRRGWSRRESRNASPDR